jgi:hypothetical protein
LQECPSLTVNRTMQEIVGRGVTNIEVDGRIEIRDFNEIRPAKIAMLNRRTTLAAKKKRRAKDGDQT